MGCEVSVVAVTRPGSSLFCSAVPMSNSWAFLFLAWPPVCRAQHEVPLRRCEEAEKPSDWSAGGWEIAIAPAVEE